MRRTLGRSEFLGLTYGLALIHIVAFVLFQRDAASTVGALAFVPGAGRWWTIVTYQFISTGMWNVLMDLLALYFIALPLEHEFGTLRFVGFYLSSVLGASASAALLGFPLMGAIHLDVSFLIVFGLLWPDVEFLLMFIIPVKVKWLAWIAAAVVILQALPQGVTHGLIYAVGMGGGVVYYFAVMKPSHRRIARKVVGKVKEAGRLTQEARLEGRNREIFERAEAIRAADAESEREAYVAELEPQVAKDVTVCPPVDFKGDKDGICIRCEGFAECTIRYLRGQPAEITVRSSERDS